MVPRVIIWTLMSQEIINKRNGFSAPAKSNQTQTAITHPTNKTSNGIPFDVKQPGNGNMQSSPAQLSKTQKSNTLNQSNQLTVMREREFRPLPIMNQNRTAITHPTE